MVLKRLRDATYWRRRNLAEWISGSIYDLTRKVNTRAPIRGESMAADLPDGAAADAKPYRATSPRAFARIMSELRIDPAEYTFVDVGAGKGRVLMFAVQLGFRRVVGIELSSTLADIARRNVGDRAIVITGDAVAVDIPTEPTVLYLFNPLAEWAMRSFLARLRANLARRQTPLWLVYFNPVLKSIVPEFTGLTVVVSHPEYLILKSPHRLMG